MHVIGQVAYYAGSAGTVTLDPTERLIAIWCVDSGGGGYVTIDGGDHIILVANTPFSMSLESRTEEWVGVALVFSGTDSFFVKTKKPAA